MGRIATVHKNLPPRMRKRVRPGGRVYYFFDTGAKPRKEISLGSDYTIALRKYSEISIITVPIAKATFGDAIIKYMAEEWPLLSSNTQHTHKSDIKHVRAFFSDAPIDQIRPLHIKQFLAKHKAIPTTANRCKRLFSTIWNHARGWGYTDMANPCEGIQGHSLKKRTVYIDDDLFAAVYAHASAPLQDAMDLAYLTGQRPADALLMTERDIIDGCLKFTQGKTGKILRITVSGKLAELMDRIVARKATHKIVTAALLTNTHGKALTAPALRSQFAKAKAAAAAQDPDMKAALKEFWFYDLRAKAADDTSDQRGDQAASDLLGHEGVKTTQRHYLRRGKIVSPTR